MSWQVKKLGEVCNIIGGGTPSKSKSAFYSGDIPWATVRDMRTSNLTDTEFKITEEGLKKSSSNLIPAGNVIIATRVGLGKVCLLGQDTAINQDLRAIIPKDDKLISKRFLFWWLNSISKIIEDEGTGATVKGVKLPFIKNLPFPLFDIQEQKRIVALLDAAFEQIDQAKAIAQQNLQNAHEIFDRAINQIFIEAGEDWADTEIGDLCDFLNGFAFKSSDSVKSSRTQLVRMGNLYNNVMNLKRNPVFYPDRFVDDFKKYLLNSGDIILSLTGTVGKEDYGYAVVVPDVDLNLLLNQRIAKFINIDSTLINSRFLVFILRSKAFLKKLYQTANGTRQANLSTSSIKKLKIPVCPLKEQEKILDKLERLQKLTNSLDSIYQQKITALDELKQSLLQQAFSGQLTREKDVA